AVARVVRRVRSALCSRLISLPLANLTFFFFFSSRRRHTRSKRDWSSDVCSSDLPPPPEKHITSDHTASPRRARTATPNDNGVSRSEERRVGKECRSRWSPDQ